MQFFKGVLRKCCNFYNVFATIPTAHAEYIGATEGAEEPELPGVYTGTRPSFTMEEPPNYAVLNSITDHPEFGNEFDFVSITDLSTGKCYRGDEIITLKPNQEYRVEAFCRNDAANNGNYANNVTFSARMPRTMQAGANKQITVEFSSTSTVPETVSGSVMLKANQNLIIEYVADVEPTPKDPSGVVKQLSVFELIVAIGLLAALAISLANLWMNVKLRNAMLLQCEGEEDTGKEGKFDWFEQSRNAGAQDKDDDEENFSGSGRPDDQS